MKDINGADMEKICVGSDAAFSVKRNEIFTEHK